MLTGIVLFGCVNFRIKGQDRRSGRSLRQERLDAVADVSGEPSGGERRHLLVPRRQRLGQQRTAPRGVGVGFDALGVDLVAAARLHRLELRPGHQFADQQTAHQQFTGGPFRQLHLSAHGR